MKERHDVEASVTRTQFENLADAARRRANVGVRQRHDLRPRGRARRMQEYRDVVRLRELLGPGSCPTTGAQLEGTRLDLWHRPQLNDPKPTTVRHRSSWRGDPFG